MSKQSVLSPDFEKRGGFVTAIAQDVHSGKILMCASANKEAYLATLQTGLATYFSKSRGKLWVKGEESHDTQKVKQILIDCDGDAIVYVVEQQGAGACHTKAWSCFYRDVLTIGQLMPAPKAGHKEELKHITTEVTEDLLNEAINKD